MLAISALAAAALVAHGPSAPVNHSSASRAADTYTYRTVSVPGSANTFLTGVNVSGAYVGAACNEGCSGSYLQFVATPTGKLTFFGIPFADYDSAYEDEASGIDNAGDVVGDYADSVGGVHGYLRSPSGAMTEINDPLADDSQGGTGVEGISANGQVVFGYYIDSSGDQNGFVDNRGTFTTYDVPGASATIVAFDHANEFGGEYTSSTGALFGFYVLDGALHTVAAPGQSTPAANDGTQLTGLTGDGTLLGFVTPATGPLYGFADRNNVFSDIIDPDEVAAAPMGGTIPLGASLQGTVVGEYTYDIDGDSDGFIATPRS